MHAYTQWSPEEAKDGSDECGVIRGAALSARIPTLLASALNCAVRRRCRLVGALNCDSNELGSSACAVDVRTLAVRVSVVVAPTTVEEENNRARFSGSTGARGGDVIGDITEEALGVQIAELARNVLRRVLCVRCEGRDGRARAFTALSSRGSGFPTRRRRGSGSGSGRALCG